MIKCHPLDFIQSLQICICRHNLQSPFSVAHMSMCLGMITWDWTTYEGFSGTFCLQLGSLLNQVTAEISSNAFGMSYMVFTGVLQRCHSVLLRSVLCEMPRCACCVLFHVACGSREETSHPHLSTRFPFLMKPPLTLLWEEGSRSPLLETDRRVLSTAMVTDIVDNIEFHLSDEEQYWKGSSPGRASCTKCMCTPACSLCFLLFSSDL